MIGRARPPRDQGSASVLALVVVGVLLSVTVAGSFMGSAVVASRKAESAADLAALAGAQAVQRGDDGCAAATRLAHRNGGTVQMCRIDAEDVLVTVAVAPASSLVARSIGGRVTGSARAGPDRGPAH